MSSCSRGMAPWAGSAAKLGGHHWGRGRHWCKRVGKQVHVNPSLLLGPAVCLHTHKEHAAQSQEREIF